MKPVRSRRAQALQLPLQVVALEALAVAVDGLVNDHGSYHHAGPPAARTSRRRVAPVPICLLVRHGRTTANASGTLAGWTAGVGLDDTGRSQVLALGKRLARAAGQGAW